MAKRRKKSSSGGGGGGSGMGVLVFLLLLACVGGALYYLRDTPIISRPTPKPPANTNNTTVNPPPNTNIPPKTPVGPAIPPENPPRVVVPPKIDPVVPAIPKTNPLENSPKDVEDVVLPTKTVAQRIAEVGPAARKRLKADFAKAGVSYPPSTVVLVGLKRERYLEVWAGDDPDNFRPIKAYHIVEISGQYGPKLREGDRQVPEGVYRIAALNPNSPSYLSLLLDYPNDMDRNYAARDGRSSLGGGITIHGGEGSFSTIPIGTAAIEELFTLTADTGTKSIRVILAPCDLRKGLIARPEGSPAWTDELYRHLREQMLVTASRGG